MSDPSHDLIDGIAALRSKLSDAKTMISKRIIGQEDVVNLSLIALLCGGHGLLVGVPGLAKTLLVETLGTVMGLDSKRVQFTPDLMPSDILGAEVLETGSDGSRMFKFIEGPIFCQLMMADEINRASPRTQSALLQAMQEKQVTIAGQHRKLAAPFHVLATQNPIEQEGTYPLPEAQLDRFLLQIDVDYPTREVERQIMIATTGVESEGISPVFTAEELIAAGAPIASVWFADRRMGPTLIAYGPREQQARYLPGMLDGSDTWCIGMSEPNAGSDLAALSTSARRDGDEWVISGQKIWTSYGHVADYQELLVRTSRGEKKHDGLTWVICPMDAPGIEVRTITTISGSQHFCEIFYDNVRIPMANVVG